MLFETPVFFVFVYKVGTKIRISVTTKLITHLFPSRKASNKIIKLYCFVEIWKAPQQKNNRAYFSTVFVRLISAPSTDRPGMTLKCPLALLHSWRRAVGDLGTFFAVPFLAIVHKK